MYNGDPLYQTKQFIYIDASFNEKGDRPIHEVKRRVAIAETAMDDLHKIWGNKELRVPNPWKKKRVQLIIWPVQGLGSS